MAESTGDDPDPHQPWCCRLQALLWLAAVAAVVAAGGVIGTVAAQWAISRMT